MQCNIDRKGRVLRGLNALALVGLAIVGWLSDWPWWLNLLFLLSGLFSGFEAVRGWCILRACGFKTKY